MKILVRYIILIVCGAVFATGWSPRLQQWTENNGLTFDEYRYGDLYMFSNLAQFKQKKELCFGKILTHSLSRYSLIVLGDSFADTNMCSATDFNATNYRFVHWNDSLKISPKQAQNSILVIEIVERNVREKLKDSIANISIEHSAANVYEPIVPIPKPWLQWKGIEKRLQRTLFENDFMLSIKEYKALFNYTFLGKTDANIALSPDKKHIFLAQDTCCASPQSSFSVLPELALNSCIEQLNRAYTMYKNAGFREVYLSIIPNKATILSPTMGKYNHLIEKIQESNLLQMPVINSYHAMKSSKNPEGLYLKSDSHWTCTARQQWISQVNKVLIKCSL